MISSDFVRVFLTIVDRGSFSAASEVLNRSQTAISYSIRSLEDQLGVTLFDRSGRRPVLTPAGAALIPEAQKIVHGIDNLRVKASAIASGTEAELTIVIDGYFPAARLRNPLRDLATHFPDTHIRLRTTNIGQALATVADGRATLGIVSHATSQNPDFQHSPIAGAPIRIIPVVARDHPLASAQRELTARQLGDHIQIITELGLPFITGEVSRRLWHCTDLETQRQMLLAGIGWSALPEHLIAQDMAAGRLLPLHIKSWSDGSWNDIAMGAIHRADTLLGPVAKWLIDRLAQEQDEDQE